VHYRGERQRSRTGCNGSGIHNFANNCIRQLLGGAHERKEVGACGAELLGVDACNRVRPRGVPLFRGWLAPVRCLVHTEVAPALIDERNVEEVAQLLRDLRAVHGDDGEVVTYTITDVLGIMSKKRKCGMMTFTIVVQYGGSDGARDADEDADAVPAKVLSGVLEEAARGVLEEAASGVVDEEVPGVVEDGALNFLRNVRSDAVRACDDRR
jgi:hypothetical protein